MNVIVVNAAVVAANVVVDNGSLGVTAAVGPAVVVAVDVVAVAVAPDPAAAIIAIILAFIAIIVVTAVVYIVDVVDAAAFLLLLWSFRFYPFPSFR